MLNSDATDDIETELNIIGYSIRSGAALQAWLGAPWQDWRSFAASWNDLGEDQHMADGGRYRRRRYAVFDMAKGTISRAPHQPHCQSIIYNRLNGGLERRFEPVSPEVGQHPITRMLIRRLAAVFEKIVPPRGASASWYIELHQFRIEARPGSLGHPTPEGIHRDGVDGAFVMLINRENVASGVTEIFSADGSALGRFWREPRGRSARGPATPTEPSPMSALP